jgi:AcrR family transcriptional regulator
MRELASSVGLQAASLYRYFPSKQALLFDIMKSGQHELLSLLKSEVLTRATPVERLESLVRMHVDFFLARPNEVRIVYSEMKSLTPLNLKKLITLRDEYDAGVKAILSAGRMSGDFEISDIAFTEKAIITMLSAVLSWYKPDGRLSHERLIRNYTELVFKLVLPIPAITSPQPSGRGQS